MKKGYHWEKQQRKKKQKKMIIFVLIALLLALILIAVFGEEDNFAQKIFSSLGYLALAIVGIGVLLVAGMFETLGGQGEAKRIISCQDCGYVGAKGPTIGSECPRCGSPRITTIRRP